MLIAYARGLIANNPNNPVVARWVADHNQMAGLNTDTLPNATALFVPLVGSQRTIGALLCIGGIVVTIVTFAIASESGGMYLIAWGPAIFGGIQFCRGFFQLVTS